MTGPQSDLHVYLRDWRHQRGLTLEQLANEIGSKANTISGWETGNRTVDLDDLKKIADYYGIHPASLLFAPEGDPNFDGLQQASRILNGIEARKAKIWLEMGEAMLDPPADTPP